jgi:hypothetical protein
MIIPKDDGKSYRLKKFVQYQQEVPPVHRAILIDYAKEKNLNSNDLIRIAWLMSNTYHELTALLMFEEVPFSNQYYKNFKIWYLKNENKIQFGSAKKYNAMNQRFLTTIEFYEKNYGKDSFKIFKSITKDLDPKKNYESLIRFNQSCKNHGRFSSDLFNEIVMMYQQENMLDSNIKSNEIFDWENCANLTSSVLNLLYRDDLADRFDAKKMSKSELKILEPCLNLKVKEIKKEIEYTYQKKIDTAMFITKLCSFRNLFKNNRYGGFHHDRQLEYLLKYNKDFPDKKNLWKDVLKFRKKNYKAHFLGEINGWTGVRKKRKKIWTTTGMTGVEIESLKFY